MIVFGDVFDDAAAIALRPLPVGDIYANAAKCRISTPAALAAAARGLHARWPQTTTEFATLLACEQIDKNTFVARPATYVVGMDTQAAGWHASQEKLRAQSTADLDALTSYQRDLDAMAREALTYVVPLEALAKSLEAQAVPLLARLEDHATFRKTVNDVSQVVATLVAFVPVVGDLLSLAITLGTLAWQMRQTGDVMTAEGERVKAGNPNRAQALINLGNAMRSYADLLDVVEHILRATDSEWLNASRQRREIQTALGVTELVAPPAAPTPTRAPLPVPAALTIPRWAPLIAGAIVLWWWFR